MVLTMARRLLCVAFAVVRDSVHGVSVVVHRRFMFQVRGAFMEDRVRFLMAFRCFDIGGQVCFRDVVFCRYAHALGIANQLSALSFDRRFTRGFARFLMIVSCSVHLSIFLRRFSRFVNDAFLGRPANGRLAIARVDLLGDVSQFSTCRLYRWPIRWVDVVLDLVDVKEEGRFRFRRFQINCVVGSRRVNANFFSHEAVDLRDVEIRSQGRFTKAISGTFIRVHVGLIHRVNVDVGRFCFHITMCGFFIRSVTVDDFIVDVNGVSSDRKFESIVHAGPIDVQGISAGHYHQVGVANGSDNDSCFDQCAFRFVFLRDFIRQEVIFGPLNVATSGFHTIDEFSVLRVGRQFPANFRTRQITVAFNGPIRGIGPQVGILRPGGYVLIGILRIAHFVRPSRLTSGHFLHLVLDGDFHFLRPMSGLLGHLHVGSTCFPCLFLRLSVLFRRAAIRTVQRQDLILQIFRYVMRIFNFLLHRSIMMITNKNRRGIFAIDLVRPLQRSDQIRGRKRRFDTGLFNDLSI